MQVFGRTAALLLAAAMCCGLVQAQVPRQISYQGMLSDPGILDRIDAMERHLQKLEERLETSTPAESE